jgi:hypothetical protein
VSIIKQMFPLENFVLYDKEKTLTENTKPNLCSAILIFRIC